MVIKWMKRLKLMRISKYVLVITLLLSLIFCGFTVYGARTGNFNIYLHADDIQLGIYMVEDKSDLGSHFSVPVLDKMDNTTYEDLAMPYIREKIMNGLGSKNDEDHKQYLAFSFVLGNYSERMVNYDIELSVISSAAGLEGINVIEALRVLVIKETGYENGPTYELLETQEQKDALFRSGTIYAKRENSEENEQYLKENTDYTTEYFLSDLQLFKKTENDFEPNAEIKYTFVFWLEGWDADCINGMYGSKIKMRLDITGR